MGLCESSKNQAATTQQVANTAQASSNAGIMDTVKNAFGSNTNTQQNSSGGIMDTVKNAFGSNTNTQQKSSGGIIDTVKNAFGSNTTTTNTATPSKMDTVTKVGKFVVENKDALGNLIS